MQDASLALPRIVEVEDLESAVELCYRENWTDGLDKQRKPGENYNALEISQRL